MLWYIVPVIISTLFVFLQTILQSAISINGIYPNLILIGLLYYGSSRQQLYGQLMGLALGLIVDFLSEAPLGFSAFQYTLIGFLIGTIKEKVYSDSILTPLFITVIALVIKELIAFVLVIIFRQIQSQTAISASALFLHMLYTLLLIPIIFAILGFIDKSLPRKKRGGYQK